MINTKSKIDKLINELCSDGVEFKELGEVVKILRGKRLTKNQLSDNEKYPVYHGGLEPLGYYGMNNRIGNTVMIINVGASAGTVGYSFVDFWSSDGCFCLEQSNLLISRYAYYALICHEQIIKSKVRFAGIPTLDTQVIEKIKIPIPPVEVQEEIVRILDSFTALEAELEAELEARKKQYEYYRDELLSFGDEVEWKTLSEVSVEFGRGKSKHRPRNDIRLYEGNIPFIQTGDIRNASHIITQYTQTYSDFGLKQSKLWPKGTLCITIAANIAETAILGFDSCFPDSIIGFVADPEKTSSSYVEYLLSTYKSNLQSKSTGSAQENINLSTFENLHLPFPPLEEQARIVAILDKFDALVNGGDSGAESGMTGSLPAELKARRQQYEYYRNKLLTFKELKK